MAPGIGVFVGFSCQNHSPGMGICSAFALAIKQIPTLSQGEGGVNIDACISNSYKLAIFEHEVPHSAQHVSTVSG